MSFKVCMTVAPSLRFREIMGTFLLISLQTSLTALLFATEFSLMLFIIMSAFFKAVNRLGFKLLMLSSFSSQTNIANSGVI